jgi:hypothetical protein
MRIVTRLIRRTETRRDRETRITAFFGERRRETGDAFVIGSLESVGRRGHEKISQREIK